MFICESGSFLTPFGNIQPTMRSSSDFLRCEASRGRAEVPQKVKNIDTRMPIAAAPVARTKAAISRSRLPLKTMRLSLSSWPAAGFTSAGSEPSAVPRPASWLFRSASSLSSRSRRASAVAPLPSIVVHQDVGELEQQLGQLLFLHEKAKTNHAVLRDGMQ